MSWPVHTVEWGQSQPLTPADCFLARPRPALDTAERLWVVSAFEYPPTQLCAECVTGYWKLKMITCTSLQRVGDKSWGNKTHLWSGSKTIKRIILLSSKQTKKRKRNYTHIWAPLISEAERLFSRPALPSRCEKPVVGLWLGKGFDQKCWVANPGWLPGCGVLSSPEDTDGYGWA